MAQNIRHEWSIMCTGISVDKETNNLTLFNIIEQIQLPKQNLLQSGEGAQKKSTIPLAFYLISMWRRSEINTPLKGAVEIQLTDPQGKTTQTGSYKIEFAGTIERLRSWIQWVGLDVDRSGLYALKVFFKEDGKNQPEPMGETYLSIEITG